MTTKSAPRELYLVDGTYNVFRAFHARGVPEMRAPDATPTKATYIFTRMLIALIESRRPHWLGVAFDLEGPTFRHETYDRFVASRPDLAPEMIGYKGTRQETPEDLLKQLPFCKEVCSGFGTALLELDGYEADDLIGTIAVAARGAGIPVVIVTADKDLFQLVGEGITILNPHKDNLEMDAGVVEREFGVRPDQVVDVLALMGDATDNIPGVPGIGEKGARDLVREFGSLEDALAAGDRIKRKAYREALARYPDRARLSRELATIRTDAPVPFDLAGLQLREPDRAGLGRLFARLAFRSLEEKYGSKGVPEVSTGRATVSDDEPGTFPARDYRLVLDLDDLKAFVARARSAGRVAIDTETTSTDPMRADLVGVSLSIRPWEAIYVPVGHRYLGAPEQPAVAEVLRILAPILEDPAIARVGQNLKYDLTVLQRAGAAVGHLSCDTMLAAWMIDPSRHSLGLDALAQEYLGDRKIPFSSVAGGGGFEMVDVERAATYAGTDADVTFRLAAALEPILAADGLEPLFRDVEMPLVPVLAAMEQAGVRIDAAYLRALSEEMRVGMERIGAEIWNLAGHEFNIDSPKQLRVVLFEELGLKPGGRTAKTKEFSTRDEDLEELATQHPLPARLRDYRGLAKLRSTYAEALPKMVNPRTGRVHASFNQTGAASGRLSSSDPNLQNIPIRTEEGRKIRKAFVPEPGWRLVTADYSQIELRILAHMAGDEALTSAFEQGEDVHRRTAAQIFGQAYDLITTDQRRVGKTINFGVIYGMSDFRLARELGLPRGEAKRFIETYFERYGAVRRYIDETIRQTTESGLARTLFGRIRRFPDITSKNFNVRQQAQRAAVNTTIQGTAADLIKKAMIAIHAGLGREGLRARLLIQVHDELVFEAPPGETDALRDLVRREMEGAAPLRVPLTVDFGEGESWLDAK